MRFLNLLVAKELYGGEFIPLHRPVFGGNEKQYVSDCIDSNFVSSVGAKVTEFESMVAKFCGVEFGVATVNGTAALHISLVVCGVDKGHEVITQPLTFVATCNAISYVGAHPVFVDVDRDTMGLSPESLRSFLESNASIDGDRVVNKDTGRRISACVPMHTFGMPCRIDEILEVCSEWGLPVVEDAAESLGSTKNHRKLGSFGRVAAVSFNGNKNITTGGGGIILTDDKELATTAKHLTTTAKKNHPYEFFHDEVGYNYRMPNLNAALGCAQMEYTRLYRKQTSQISGLNFSINEDTNLFGRLRELFRIIG